MVVTVVDRGVGFDTELLDDDLLARPLYSGLARATVLADGLAIDSKPGAGTTVVLHFTSTCASSTATARSTSPTTTFLTARRRATRVARVAAPRNFVHPSTLARAGRRRRPLLAGPEPRALAERALWRLSHVHSGEPDPKSVAWATTRTCSTSAHRVDARWSARRIDRGIAAC
jgi:hypothetical protein